MIWVMIFVVLPLLLVGVWRACAIGRQRRAEMLQARKEFEATSESWRNHSASYHSST